MQFSLTKKGDCTYIQLAGHVDEDAKHALLLIEAQVETPMVVMDCANLMKINSIGTKDWILAFERFDKRFHTTFVRCTTAFIDMAVMVPSFVKKRPIMSFFVASACDACKLEKQSLIEVKDGKCLTKVPSLTCERCGDAMLIDEDLNADIELVKRLQNHALGKAS